MRLVGLSTEFSGQKIKGIEQFPSVVLAEKLFLAWNSELR